MSWSSKLKSAPGGCVLGPWKEVGAALRLEVQQGLRSRGGQRRMEVCGECHQRCWSQGGEPA